MNRFLIRYPAFRKKALTLSYDDGVIQDKRLIALLDRYGLKCTFNLIGYTFSQQQDWPDFKYGPNVTRQEAPDVYRNHEIAIHGFQHPFLDELPAGNAAWQITKDRETLETLFGRIIRGMAYPMGGTQSDALVNTVRSCGILYARTAKSSHSFDIPQDWLRLEPTCYSEEAAYPALAKEFTETDVRFLPKLFYMWGHSYEFDNGDGWNRMEAFCRLVAGRTDIWYATNGEIFEYLEAAKHLICSADGTLLHNPTAVDIYLENYHSGKQYVLPGGETMMAR